MADKLKDIKLGQSVLTEEQADSKYVDVASSQDVSGRKTFKGGIAVGEGIPDLGTSVFGVGSQLSVGSSNWFWKCIDLSIDSSVEGVAEWAAKTNPNESSHPEYTFAKLSGGDACVGNGAGKLADWLYRIGLLGDKAKIKSGEETPIFTAKIHLCREQPNWPGPFVIYNGVSSQFRMNGYLMDVDQPETLSCLSAPNAEAELGNGSDNMASIGPQLLSVFKGEANCDKKDYNQFIIDGLMQDGQLTASLETVAQKLKDMIADAMKPDESLEPWKLKAEDVVGQELTLVNQEKAQFWRCMKVAGVDETGTILTVAVYPKVDDCSLEDSGYGVQRLNKCAASFLLTRGAAFCDFAADDYSLAFPDKPTLPGPDTKAVYGAAAVGEKNVVKRRCTLAAGKDNTCEQDFAIAMGRKAHADHYNSFIWANNKNTHSAGSSTFTVGMMGSGLRNMVNYMNEKFVDPMWVSDANDKKFLFHRWMLMWIIEQIKHCKKLREEFKAALNSTENQMKDVVAADFPDEPVVD